MNVSYIFKLSSSCLNLNKRMLLTTIRPKLCKIENYRSVVCYFSTLPKPPTLSEAANVTEQISNLRGKEVEFGPSRSQDVFQNAVEEVSQNSETSRHIETSEAKEDDKEHVAAYQCETTVHLNAVMQSMVPDPFIAKGKAPVHLNMPGGSRSRDQKYLSDHQNCLHQTSDRTGENNIQIIQKRDLHQGSSPGKENLTRSQKLQQAVKDYGSTVLGFHITMSLGSLGLVYLAVSSGLDVASLLDKIGFSSSTIMVGGSTFVVSYAIHKLFAPVRIGITLSATPFIVKFLRKKGILKPPKVMDLKPKE